MNSIHIVPTSSPNDVEGIKYLIDTRVIKPEEVIAVLGKTEGNGCVNDWTRGYSVYALKNFFEGYLDKERAGRIIYVMSGGTEGVLSPHLALICSNDTEGPKNGLEKSLVIGVTRTKSILPEQLGRMEQVNMVRDSVKEAMKMAKITDPKDVHFVQIKCPLLTAPRIKAAYDRGADVITEDTYKSMGYSRGACALGIGLALGEIEEGAVTGEKICHDWSLYSNVASTSAGIELMECEIILLGNSVLASGNYYIEHEVMKDSIDAGAVMEALNKAKVGYLNTENDASRELVHILAKAEADPSGYVRGRRTVMLEDSDINHTRHARAVVGGVLASIVGDPMVYVSGGGEHQGPAGGGPVAVICKKN